MSATRGPVIGLTAEQSRRIIASAKRGKATTREGPTQMKARLAGIEARLAGDDLTPQQRRGYENVATVLRKALTEPSVEPVVDDDEEGA